MRDDQHHQGVADAPHVSHEGSPRKNRTATERSAGRRGGGAITGARGRPPAAAGGGGGGGGREAAAGFLAPTHAFPCALRHRAVSPDPHMTSDEPLMDSQP